MQIWILASAAVLLLFVILKWASYFEKSIPDTKVREEMMVVYKVATGPFKNMNSVVKALSAVIGPHQDGVGVYFTDPEVEPDTNKWLWAYGASFAVDDPKLIDIEAAIADHDDIHMTRIPTHEVVFVPHSMRTMLVYLWLPKRAYSALHKYFAEHPDLDAPKVSMNQGMASFEYYVNTESRVEFSFPTEPMPHLIDMYLQAQALLDEKAFVED